MPTPVTSIIIPCYNQARFLGEAIESSLCQGAVVEIIVVNDGSTDHTSDVARSAVQKHGPNVELVMQSNRGRSAARNAGALRARGDFLIFLDADDLLHPGMMLAVSEVVSRRPTNDVYYAGWWDVDELGTRQQNNEPADFESDPFHTLMRAKLPIHCCMVRREAFMQAGMFDTHLDSHEDWDLWLRLALRGRGYCRVPGSFASYRRYPTSSSANTPRMVATRYQVLWRHQHSHSQCPTCARIVCPAMATMRDMYSRVYLRNLWHKGLLSAQVADLVSTTRDFLRRCLADPLLGLAAARAILGLRAPCPAQQD